MSKQIKKNETTQVELLSAEKVNRALNIVFSASQPKDLEKPLKTLVETKEVLKTLKTALKKIEEEPKQIINTVNVLFKTLEADIKYKALELYEEKHVRKENKSTGEVTTVLENNLGKKKFTYTPAKTIMVVDKDQLLAIGKDEEYQVHDFPELGDFIDKLVVPKTIYVIDEVALAEHIQEHGTKVLPMKQVTTEPKLGIQYAQILSDIKTKAVE